MSKELQYPCKETIDRLVKDLHLNHVNQYTQDWEIEVVNSDYLSEYIEYYNSQSLNYNEKSTLMRIILEAFNQYYIVNIKDDQYWSLIEKNIITDYYIHKDTVQYWCCDGEELDDSFAITYLVRNIKKKMVDSKTY